MVMRRVRQIVRGRHDPTPELPSVAPLLRAAWAFKHYWDAIARELAARRDAGWNVNGLCIRRVPGLHGGCNIWSPRDGENAGAMPRSKTRGPA